ncbi:hypothetical protein F5I97DRAFT_820194 [Phlebopus sp. FC_14]|nr:hypothetical protein F5I97DRAFT_820194 [Phlebopus sp. FC_14]
MQNRTTVPFLYTHHHQTSRPKTHSTVFQLLMVCLEETNTTCSQKRKRTNDDDDYADSARALPKTKSIQEAVHGGPTKAFGSKLLMEGMLFNASYILGRDTVVWAGRRDAGRVSARKVWQSENALEILSKDIHDNVLHPNVVDTKEDSAPQTFTPDGIRGDVLEVRVTDVARLVMFFWSIQDFVMGLRDALIGHEYLVQIGILHRDISENNILLAPATGLVRGYMTDFDMAIPYDIQAVPQQASRGLLEYMHYLQAKQSQTLDSLPPVGLFKAERTGTAPFMSINVLGCRSHTHYDDIESFLYVLVLFFMIYKHPLPAVDLCNAKTRDYTQNVTNARHPHITDWPSMFQLWNTPHARHSKLAFFSVHDHAEVFEEHVQDCWKNNDVALSIADLFESCRDLFTLRPEQRVSHKEFIAMLDEWLEHYPVPPPGYNSCPSQGPGQKQAV